MKFTFSVQTVALQSVMVRGSRKGWKKNE
jgi:hypothetical protein